MKKQNGFVIIDVAGLALTAEDKELLQHPCVAGVILFSRNYEELSQLRELTAAIKKTRPQLFIAVDHEGGRVQRFRQGFTELPSMGHFGDLWQQTPEAAQQQLHRTITQAAQELKAAGIHVNFAPVLDIDHRRNQVIGARSFGHDANVVTTLGKVAIDALRAMRMPAIGKHFPGHGGVTTDSHETLPIDDRDTQTIYEQDLLPFIKLLPHLDAIMPAHIVYTAFDRVPAGFSRFWLHEMLRRQLKFEGVVISDDLSMQGAAAMGNYTDRARLALEAGCDLLMVCNNRTGAEKVLESLENYYHAESLQRIAQFIVKCDFAATTR